MKPIYDFITNTCAAGKPFFVWYAPMMAHNPHDPPERLLQKYRDQTPSLEVAKYWAMVDWFDETVGELLGFLDQTGRAENTIVVYVSDNGWIQDPAGPKFARKSKNSPYDGGLRTPIMIRWPGRVRPERSAAFAQSIDFVPTLLTAVGIKPSRDLPGINLLDARAVRARRYVYGECFTPRAQDLDRPGANLCWQLGDRGRLEAACARFTKRTRRSCRTLRPFARSPGTARPRCRPTRRGQAASTAS